MRLNMERRNWKSGLTRLYVLIWFLWAVFGLLMVLSTPSVFAEEPAKRVLLLYIGFLVAPAVLLRSSTGS